MVAPLRSANPGPAKDLQFKHFGVLDTGGQSKASTVTSLVVNLAIAFVLIVISAAAAKQTIARNKLLTHLVVPIEEKKPEPIKPKVIPPKPQEGLYKLTATISHSPTGDPAKLSEMFGYAESTPVEIKKTAVESN